MAMPGMRTARSNIRLVGCVINGKETVYVVKTPPNGPMEMIGKLVGYGSYQVINLLKEKLSKELKVRLWQTSTSGAFNHYLHCDDYTPGVLDAIRAQGNYGNDIVDRVLSKRGKDGKVEPILITKGTASIRKHKDFAEKRLN